MQDWIPGNFKSVPDTGRSGLFNTLMQTESNKNIYVVLFKGQVERFD